MRYTVTLKNWLILALLATAPLMAGQEDCESENTPTPGVYTPTMAPSTPTADPTPSPTATPWVVDECFAPSQGSIQECIDLVADTGTVYISAGSYTESLQIYGRVVHLRGVGEDMEAVRIIGNNDDPVVSIGGQSNVTFYGLTIQDGGASGVVAYGGSNVELQRTYIYNNYSALAGGGVDVRGAMVTLNDSIVEGNWVGGGGYGGGVTVSEDGRLTLYNTEVFGNEATYGDGGGIAVLNGGSAEVYGSTVEGNSAYTGAGIYARSADWVLLDGVTIGFNTSSESGGGVFASLSTIQMKGSRLLNNQVGDGPYSDSWGEGGGLTSWGCNLNMNGVLIAGNINWEGQGGGVFAYETVGEWTNITVADNATAHEGGGIYVNTDNPAGTLQMTNAIVAYNRILECAYGCPEYSGLNLFAWDTNPEVRYSTFWDGNPSAGDSSGIFWEHDYTLDEGYANRDPDMVWAGEFDEDFAQYWYSHNPPPLPVQAGEYNLSPFSFEIDSGDTDSTADLASSTDPTDAAWPALGTTATDRGAFGGAYPADPAYY